jgi:hypothetical protein
VIGAVALQLQLPLADVVAVGAARQGPLHYGHYRGLGTAAYVAANLVGGALVLAYGSGFVVLWCLVASLTGMPIAKTPPLLNLVYTIHS